MLARSMARVMGAWLGPRVDTGEIHTMASASLLRGKWRALSRWPRALTGQPNAHPKDRQGTTHLTNWHSPSLTITVTVLPASRELPEMVSLVPPEAGPRMGRTRSNVGVCGRGSPEGREEAAQCGSRALRRGGCGEGRAVHAPQSCRAALIACGSQQNSRLHTAPRAPAVGWAPATPPSRTRS